MRVPWELSPILLLAVPFLGTAGRPEMSDEQQIAALLERFVVAWNTGDTAAAVAVYSDPHVDVNAETPLETRAMTEAKWRELFERVETTIAVTSDELIIDGDWAFQRGELLQTVTPREDGSAATVTVKRRYLEVLKRDPTDGWRVFWAIDGPVAERERARE